MELENVDVLATIRQHNTITSGRFDFTACQLDIMFMIMSLLKKSDALDTVYTVRVKSIEAITGRNWSYSRVDEATDLLMGRVYKIKNEIGLKKIVLFSEMQYIAGSGEFEVKINPSARQYFFDLKDNFTVLQLHSILSCSSKHAKRLYAIACQWRSVGGHTFEIDELKEMLGLRDPLGVKKEQYVNIPDFKRAVLDIAKKQINDNTDIGFDYKLIKRGRSYTKIKISTFLLNTVQMALDFKKTESANLETAEYLRKVDYIMAVGISEKLARIWATTHYKEFVEAKKETMQKMNEGKQIDDKEKYIVGIFKNKGYPYK